MKILLYISTMLLLELIIINYSRKSIIWTHWDQGLFR